MLRLFIISFLLAPLLPAAAQQLQFVADVEGMSEPLAEVPVRMSPLGGPDAGKEEILFTDKDGKVTCPWAVPTQWVLMAYGYKEITDTIDGVSNHVYRVPTDEQVLGPVVVTPLYGVQYAHHAIQKIRVLDRQRIDNQGAVNLRDLLSNETNIRLQQDNVLGSSLSLQGLPGQNVKILIDGVPVIGRVNGNIDLSQINLNNIERVEIVEGPMSVIYGTDALGGVINLVSKTPAADTTNRLHGSLRGYYETVGHYNADANVLATIGKYGLNVGGGRNFFDGWSPDSWTDSRTQQWRPKEQYFANAAISRRIKNLKLTATGQLFDETLYNLGSVLITPQYARAIDEYYRTLRWNTGLAAEGRIGPHHYLNALANYSSYSRRRETLVKNMVTLSEQPSTDPEAQDTTSFDLLNLRTVYSWRKPQAKLNYQLGVDLNHETGTGVRIKDGEQQMGDYAAFATLQYKPTARLILSPALRAAYNTRYQAPLVPSFNLKYSLNDRTTLRFTYARGFRAPSLKELYFFFVDVNHNIQGNEDLQAERSHNLVLQLVRDWKPRNTLYRLEGSLYYNAINNWIELALVNYQSGLYSYVNVRDYYTHGANLGLLVHRKNAELRINTNLTGRYNFLHHDDMPEYYYSPELQLSPRYTFEKLKLTISGFYKYNGKLLSLALTEENGQEIVTQNFISSYHTLDLTASKKLWKDKLMLTLGGKNLVNVQNIRANQTGGAHSGGSSAVPVGYGRSVFVSTQLTW